jgi:hypothetical protein
MPFTNLDFVNEKNKFLQLIHHQLHSQLLYIVGLSLSKATDLSFQSMSVEAEVSRPAGCQVL